MQKISHFPFPTVQSSRRTIGSRLRTRTRVYESDSPWHRLVCSRPTLFNGTFTIALPPLSVLRAVIQASERSLKRIMLMTWSVRWIDALVCLDTQSSNGQHEELIDWDTSANSIRISTDGLAVVSCSGAQTKPRYL